MAVVAATEAEFDLAEVEVEFVVDDVDVCRLDPVVAGQSLDRAAGNIHEAAGACEDGAAVGQATGGELSDLSVRLLVHAQLGGHGGGAVQELVDKHGPRIVASLGVDGARVAKADDENR